MSSSTTLSSTLSVDADDGAFIPLCAVAEGLQPWREADAAGTGKVQRQVVRVDGKVVSARENLDHLAVEVPVALEFNGTSYAVMLATPTDLEDFALGFALTEGIVRRAADVYDITVLQAEDGAGIVVRLDIASACEHVLRSRRRALSGRTGCGLCGVEALPDAVRQVPAVPDMDLRIPVSSLFAAQQALRAGQVLFEATGATHAAGWSDLQGRVSCLREDVGRHNALDKLIGALRRREDALAPGFVVVSSRASFEMVQKTASAGLGALVSLSAPTSLAVDLAQRLNLALAGFLRGDGCTLYAYPQRFITA